MLEYCVRNQFSSGLLDVFFFTEYRTWHAVFWIGSSSVTLDLMNLGKQLKDHQRLFCLKMKPKLFVGLGAALGGGLALSLSPTDPLILPTLTCVHQYPSVENM